MLGADPLISRFYTKRRKRPPKTLITRNNLFESAVEPHFDVAGCCRARKRGAITRAAMPTSCLSAKPNISKSKYRGRRTFLSAAPRSIRRVMSDIRAQMVSIQTHLPRVQQLLGRVLDDLMARHGRMYAVPEQVPIRPLADGVHGDEEGQARILHIF
jgi:hypothetical protein